MTNYTYKEILDADIKDLISNAISYSGYEDGVYIDVTVAGKPLRIVAKFGNENIKEFAQKKYNLLLNDLEGLSDFYQMHDTEIDSYFLDQNKAGCLFDYLVNDQGQSVTFNGQEYALLEDAYLDDYAYGSGTDSTYKALAINASGKHYIVTWEILPGMENEEDAGKVCDWEHPASVEETDEF